MPEPVVESQGLAISRREFEQNLKAKLEDAAFLEDIEPLIRPDLVYDVQDAAEVVRAQLLSRLP